MKLIDRVKVYDRKHIEVVFCFDDCCQSLLDRIHSAGYTVSGSTGKVPETGRKEVM